MRHIDNIVSAVIIRSRSQYECVVRFSDPKHDIIIHGRHQDAVLAQLMRLVRW